MWGLWGPWDLWGLGSLWGQCDRWGLRGQWGLVGSVRPVGPVGPARPACAIHILEMFSDTVLLWFICSRAAARRWCFREWSKLQAVSRACARDSVMLKRCKPYRALARARSLNYK